MRMFSFPAFVPGRQSQVRRDRKRVSPAFPVVRRAVRRNFRQGGKCGLKPRRWGLPPLPGRGFPARRFHPPPNPWKPCPFPASPAYRLWLPDRRRSCATRLRWPEVTDSPKLGVRMSLMGGRWVQDCARGPKAAARSLFCAAACRALGLLPQGRPWAGRPA